ncbi:MAG: ABC transporter permease [Clostridiales bacterium]|nr:ABC transporter permease [Clostridiales bacterium]
MVIFKYEMRLLRAHILWWSIAVAAFIFASLPIYMSFLTSDVIDADIVGSDIFNLWGFDVQVLTTPVGTLGFLTSFLAIAAGINGMFLGLKTFTKETIGKSAEFIYTKPHKRSEVFCAKVLSALISAVVVGTFYYIGAMLSAFANISEGFDFKVSSLVALSFTWIEIFFVFFGALVGTVYSKIRSPLLVSSGVVFLFYIFATFSNIVSANAIKYFTPYAYFNTSKIIGNGGYLAGYMIAFAALCVVFLTVGLGSFTKKDVKLIS